MIYQITDHTQLDSVLSDPELQKVSWEGYPASYQDIGAQALLEMPGTCWLGYGNPIAGAFAFQRINNVCWELHLNIPPRSRRKGTVEVSKLALKWAFENIPDCLKIVATVPSKYENALRFMGKLEMECEGVSPRSYLVDGRLYDRYFFGMTKEL